jgi:hypothetical protein
MKSYFVNINKKSKIFTCVWSQKFCLKAQASLSRLVEHIPGPVIPHYLVAI